jgi:[acyl-carrier-protein] S-malonyltransferase
MTVANFETASDLALMVEKLNNDMDSSLAGLSAINSSVQLVISGETVEIGRLEMILRSNPKVKSIRRIRNISCAFHSPLMKTASEKFRREAKHLLTKIQINSDIPVISNLTASFHTQEAIVDSLARQISGTVRWNDTVQSLQKMDVSAILPIGPGNVIQNLIERDSSVTIPLIHPGRL